MIPSNTICVSQEGPANALALNKDCSQVVIAGRNVFKVFSIGENEFSEVCNLRVGKNLNLNFSSIDVAWSTIEENTLATAATNGAVVVWNLGRSGRSKQEHVFSDHKRTVNKVSFHLTEPALLISGSQDGMMKCFDLRMKEVARTFISNTESIRDVQFSPHQAHTFAAVSENGSVQLWDVWDIFGKPNLEHTIYTIASVGHVKWRPQKKFQVASCALVLDCAVHVWDVRRPHVPLATFAEHRDVTTAIAWLAEPHTFLSTSRDCSLYRHRFSSAAHPVLWANPHGVCVSARGELAHAAPERPLPALPPAHPQPDRHVPGLGRKQPTAGSLSGAAQAALERAFPGGAGSTLCRYAAPRPLPLLQCATDYRMRGAPPHDLAQHNAEVAKANNRHMVWHVWEVVRCVYSARAARRSSPAPAPPTDLPRPDPPPPPPYTHTYHNNAVEEEPLEEVEEWAETQFHNSGVLGKPTLSIYIPPARQPKHLRSDEPAGWVSAASAHYVDTEAADWTLPEEAFPLRTAPPAAPPHAPPRADQHTHGQHDKEHNASHRGSGGSGGSGGGVSPGGSSSPGSGSSGSACTAPPALDHAHLHQMHLEESISEGGAGLAVRVGCGLRPQLDVAPLLAAALRHHADLGDVVRCAWLNSVWVLSQQSTSVAVCCGRCGRRTRPHAACEACVPRRLPDACAVCRRPVRGLYAWCQGCSHGGHLHHLRRWLDQHQLCPAGCGHHCQLA
ncbi:hypothetical protein B5X24_HaOG215245 [Helicoverpa armigera]|nr:hypothetical protein B5X24_HaOG215245 [Helicoverpa armigera]